VPGVNGRTCEKDFISLPHAISVYVINTTKLTETWINRCL